MTFKLDKCYDCEYHEIDGMCVLKEYETDDNDICPDFSCVYNYCSYDDEMESKC